MRNARHSPARRQLDSIHLHACNRIGQQFSDRCLPWSSYGQTSLGVMTHDAARSTQQFFDRHLQSRGDAMKNRQRRVCLARLEMRPRRSRHFGQLGDLLLRQTSRFAKLLHVLGQCSRKISVRVHRCWCPEERVRIAKSSLRLLPTRKGVRLDRRKCARRTWKRAKILRITRLTPP